MNPHSESAYFLNPLMRIFLQSLIEYVENLINVELAVDANRSGTKDDPGITFGADDKTSEEEPYEFWINNDRDYDGSAFGTSNLNKAEDLSSGIKRLIIGTGSICSWEMQQFR